MHGRVRDPTRTRGSAIDRGIEACKTSELGVRQCTSDGGFRGSFWDGKKNRHLVNRSFPCPIDRLKEVISDDLLLWARSLIQLPLGG